MQNKWPYVNALLILLSLGISILIFQTNGIENVISNMGNKAYLVLVATGLFMASTLTIVPACMILLKFNNLGYSPFVITFIGAIGGMLGDYIGYFIARDNLVKEIEPTIRKITQASDIGSELNKRIFHSEYMFWLAPIGGAVAITIPRTERIGFALLGVFRMSAARLVSTAYLLNAFIISVLITLASF